MKVVLDSNIIIADFWLESTNFKLLFESVKKGNVKIYIPEIVLDEVINKFSKRLEDSKRKIDSELKTYKKLSRKEERSPIKSTVIEESVSDYQNHLRKIVKNNFIEVIKYPQTDHKSIAYKAINKLKPFNLNEKGYRDCLIWENIKGILTYFESATSQPELVFISNNYKDFATNEYELHPDLINELEDEDFDAESVIVYPKLSEFNEEQTKLFFKQSESFKKKLLNDELWDLDIKDSVTSYLFEKFVGSELSEYNDNFEHTDNREPTVRSIDENIEIKVESVKKVNATEFLVDIEFDVETEIDFFIDKHEYYHNDLKSNMFIEDANWNKWVMWVSSIEMISIKMSLIINTELEVKSCQINKVNSNYAQKWI